MPFYARTRLSPSVHKAPPRLAPPSSAQPDLCNLPGETLVDVLSALARCLDAPPAAWLARATASLEPKALDLSPAAAARLIWALAQLKHRPGPSLIALCCQAMSPIEPPAAPEEAAQREAVSNGVNPTLEATSSAPSDTSFSVPLNPVPPGRTLARGLDLAFTVDAVWGLSTLGAPVASEWMLELFTRLSGK